jgi:predicted RNA-binding protein Jag
MGMPGGFMQEQVTTTQVNAKWKVTNQNRHLKVTIPNELAGTIIGKGGDRINRFI